MYLVIIGEFVKVFLFSFVVHSDVGEGCIIGE